jgi:thioredoxin reductase (NADPH)
VKSDAQVAIIGGGPAGLSAGITLAAEGVKALLIERGALGGQLLGSKQLENIPGHLKISGEEWARRTAMQMRALGTFTTHGEVTKIAQMEKHWIVDTHRATWLVDAVIVATGLKWRKLDGLDVDYGQLRQLANRVSVAIVGGGNSAGQAADYLAREQNVAVTVIARRRIEETMSAYLVKRLRNNPLIRIEDDAEGINGNRQMIEWLCHEGTRKICACDSATAFVGSGPDTEWLNDGMVTADGYVLPVIEMSVGGLPLENGTYAEGVFVAGDVKARSVKRVVNALADGNNAALAAIAHLKRK